MDDLDWSGIDVYVPMADIEFCGICIGVSFVIAAAVVFCMVMV